MSINKNKPNKREVPDYEVPIDDYDRDGWLQFYAEHPGYHRSVGADGDDEHWSDGLAEGDGALKDEQMETLKGFDSQSAFANKYFELTASNGADDNWRDPFAGEDDKRATQLERFTTPIDMGNAYFELQAKAHGSELLKPLPENATDDDVKHYREQQGIPLEAKNYLKDLPDGLVIGEQDLPFMEAFVEDLHGANLLPSQVHAVIGWYNKFIETADADRHELDEALRDETEDIFREEWGNEYRKNTNLVNSLIESQFGEAADLFRDAYTGERKPLMADAGIMRGLINLSRIHNPTGVVVLGDADPNKSLDDEIAGIEKVMREDRPAYNKDQAMQDRYVLLLDARIQRDQKGQAA